MTVRFKSQTEYQRSYRSRSVSPHRCTLFAGLRSDHMGVSREPCFQRRKKVNVTLSCDAPPQTFDEPLSVTNLSKSQAGKPEAAIEAQKAEVLPEKTMYSGGSPGLGIKDQFDMKSEKSGRNTPALIHHQESPTINHSLRRKAGFKSMQHSSPHKTEYSRQFHAKKARAASSPILTAQQVLFSSHSTVPPHKKNPVAMDTEYQRSFQGLAPPTSPCLRKNQDCKQTPLLTPAKKRNKNNLTDKSEPGLENNFNNRSQASQKVSLAPSNFRKNRILTEYGSRFCIPLSKIPEDDEAKASDTPQVKEVREKALSYRRRAWGTNFSRDHLSQLQSEHNVLWEPSETIDSTSDLPQSTHLDLCQVSSVQADSGGASCLEALDLASISGRSSPAANSKDETSQMKKITKTNATATPNDQTSPVGEHFPSEERNSDEEQSVDGRLPTPKLKMLPVQRTHHDLTTPATGGAILVGRLQGTDEASVLQRSGTADSVLANAGTSVHIPRKPREAWSADSTHHKPTPSPVPKPVPAQSNPCATSVLPLTAPLHCIQGMLRHADFQHNGELGLRFKEQKCLRGCCGSDEDDRLSVMSWRSAASCSMASAVLERAQRRRDKFWGKR